MNNMFIINYYRKMIKYQYDARENVRQSYSIIVRRFGT